MSGLQYYSYDGVGKTNERDFHYSQAVRVGDVIHCAGQGGWEASTGEWYMDIDKQIDQAFVNVELAVKTAGGKGWADVSLPAVFRINSYHVPLDNQAMAAMNRNMKKWCPDHKPIWTVIGVSRLGDDRMKVEVEVQAHSPVSK